MIFSSDVYSYLTTTNTGISYVNERVANNHYFGASKKYGEEEFSLELTTSPTFSLFTERDNQTGENTELKIFEKNGLLYIDTYQWDKAGNTLGHGYQTCESKEEYFSKEKSQKRDEKGIRVDLNYEKLTRPEIKDKLVELLNHLNPLLKSTPVANRLLKRNPFLPETIENPTPT